LLASFARAFERNGSRNVGLYLFEISLRSTDLKAEGSMALARRKFKEYVTEGPIQ